MRAMSVLMLTAAGCMPPALHESKRSPEPNDPIDAADVAMPNDAGASAGTEAAASPDLDACHVPDALGDVQPTCRLNPEQVELLVINRTGAAMTGFASMGFLNLELDIRDGSHERLIDFCPETEMGFGLVGEITLDGVAVTAVRPGSDDPLLSGTHFTCGMSVAIEYTRDAVTGVLVRTVRTY